MRRWCAASPRCTTCGRVFEPAARGRPTATSGHPGPPGGGVLRWPRGRRWAPPARGRWGRPISTTLALTPPRPRSLAPGGGVLLGLDLVHLAGHLDVGVLDRLLVARDGL